MKWCKNIWASRASLGSTPNFALIALTAKKSILKLPRPIQLLALSVTKCFVTYAIRLSKMMSITLDRTPALRCLVRGPTFDLTFGGPYYPASWPLKATLCMN